MGEYWTFDKLITPALVRVVFWLGIAYAVVSAISAMFTDSFVYGVFMLIAGPLAVRIGCEILIVVFQINNTLTEIRDNQLEMTGQLRANPPSSTVIP